MEWKLRRQLQRLRLLREGPLLLAALAAEGVLRLAPGGDLLRDPHLSVPPPRSLATCFRARGQAPPTIADRRSPIADSADLAEVAIDPGIAG